ncbi:MAG: hypothetical protein AAF322_09375, partial [Pseudomonadota bacterium]
MQTLHRLIAAAALAALAVPAGAASVTEIRAETSLSVDGVQVDAVSDAGASGAVTAFGAGGTSAFQNDAGVSAASAGGFFADGSPANVGTASTGFTQSETNMTGGAVSYEIDFSLANMFLDLNGDFGGSNAGANPFNDPTSPAVGASLAYSIELNGSEVFSVGAELFGGNGVYALGDVSGLTGSLLGGSTEVPGGGERFEIDDLAGTVSLGSFGDGATLEVVARMTVAYIGGAFENAMFANIGDPNTIATGPIRALGGPTVPQV